MSYQSDKNQDSAFQPGQSNMQICVDIGSIFDAIQQVYGIAGLRVADASVMPKITNGNINAPCLMIGERAASLIRAG
jgi:hypothetical protein